MHWSYHYLYPISPGRSYFTVYKAASIYSCPVRRIYTRSRFHHPFAAQRQNHRPFLPSCHELILVHGAAFPMDDARAYEHCPPRGWHVCCPVTTVCRHIRAAVYSADIYFYLDCCGVNILSDPYLCVICNYHNRI